MSKCMLDSWQNSVVAEGLKCNFRQETWEQYIALIYVPKHGCVSRKFKSKFVFWNESLQMYL